MKKKILGMTSLIFISIVPSMTVLSCSNEKTKEEEKEQYLEINLNDEEIKHQIEQELSSGNLTTFQEITSLDLLEVKLSAEKYELKYKATGKTAIEEFTLAAKLTFDFAKPLVDGNLSIAINAEVNGRSAFLAESASEELFNNLSEQEKNDLALADDIWVLIHDVNKIYDNLSAALKAKLEN